MSIDLNNLKTQLKGIFDTANTTTALRDLSQSMETRVAKVLRVNPHRIPVQSDWFPFVTTYIQHKPIEMVEIAADQLTAKRKAEVAIKVVGCVWNSEFTTADVDPADNDCEYLMENIEQVLRANPTLAGLADWSYPTDVTYENVKLEEGVHVRAGMLNLVATIYY